LGWPRARGGAPRRSDVRDLLSDPLGAWWPAFAASGLSRDPAHALHAGPPSELHTRCEAHVLTVLNVAYPLAPVGEDAVGGAEQILSAIDAALVAAHHRSIVIACAGS